MEEVKIDFRDDSVEREWEKSRNESACDKIFLRVGIDESFPNYEEYRALTIENIHNAGEFLEYDKSIEDRFCKFLMEVKPTVEEYRKYTEDSKKEFAEEQFLRTSGKFGHWYGYDDAINKLEDTIQSGIEMREEFGTTFPEIFYDEKGALRERIVVEIPVEMQDDSAMGLITKVVNKHKEIGLSFDEEQNGFMLKGQKVGPEKFFKQRYEKIHDKFLTKYDEIPEELNEDDEEIFGIIKSGDFIKFRALCAERGKAGNKTNIIIRNTLNDEIIFREIVSRIGGQNFSKEQFVNEMREIAEEYNASSIAVRKEAEKDTLGKIDRVLLSINPRDVATQSTFRDWQSCMHTGGCNFRYVDDSIGVGSIVAYGFDSKNPQKMISRLLIHPFENASGDVCYGVNNRIYGKENLGFRSVVDEVVKKTFNEDKHGLFVFNKGKQALQKGYLYNDGNAGRILHINVKDNDIVNLNDLSYQGVIDLSEVDLSKAGKIIVGDGMKIIGAKVDERFDFSECKRVCFSGETYINGAKFPDGITTEFSRATIVSGSDLSNISQMNVEHSLNVEDNVVLSKKISTGVSDLKGVYKDVEINASTIDFTDASFDGGVRCNADKLIFRGNTYLNDFELSDGCAVMFNNVLLCSGSNLSNLDKIVVGGYNLFEDKSILSKEIEGNFGSKVSGVIDSDTKIVGKYISFENIELSDKVLFDTNGCISFCGNVFLPKGVNYDGEAKFYDVTLKEGSDVSKLSGVIFGGKTKIEPNTNLGESIRFDDVKLEDGSDFSGCEKAKFNGSIKFGEHIKSSKIVHFGYGCEILSDIDVSSSDEAIFEGRIKNIGCKLKYPEKVTLDRFTTDDEFDFSKVKILRLKSSVYENPKVMLPEKVYGKDVIFQENVDLDKNGVEELFLEGIIRGKNPKLAKKTIFNDAIIEGIDLSENDCILVVGKTEFEDGFHNKLVGPKKCILKDVDLVDTMLPDSNNLIFLGDCKLKSIDTEIDSRCDFSRADKLSVSRVNFGENVKFPEGGEVVLGYRVGIASRLDLSKASLVDLEADEFKKEIILPENGKYKFSPLIGVETIDDLVALSQYKLNDNQLVYISKIKDDIDKILESSLDSMFLVEDNKTSAKVIFPENRTIEETKEILKSITGEGDAYLDSIEFVSKSEILKKDKVNDLLSSVRGKIGINGKNDVDDKGLSEQKTTKTNLNVSKDRDF